MNNHHNHDHNHHANLFLPGVIVGAGLLFLLGTKRGREVLKVVMDEGVDRFSEYLTGEGAPHHVPHPHEHEHHYEHAHEEQPYPHKKAKIHKD